MWRRWIADGVAAARVDLAYEYHLPPSDGRDRPLTLHRPQLFRFATTEEYFGTIRDACPR